MVVGHDLHISKEKDMMVLVVARRFMDKFMEEGALYDWISTIMLPFLGYMQNFTFTYQLDLFYSKANFACIHHQKMSLLELGVFRVIFETMNL